MCIFSLIIPHTVDFCFNTIEQTHTRHIDMLKNVQTAILIGSPKDIAILSKYGLFSCIKVAMISFHTYFWEGVGISGDII